LKLLIQPVTLNAIGLLFRSKEPLLEKGPEVFEQGAAVSHP
jgi:hypothetical protein